MIEFSCPCGEPLAAADEHAGAEVACPRCARTLSVPGGGPKRGRVLDDPPPRPRRKKKRRRRNYGDDDTPDHVRRLMEKANAELDEDEARRSRQGRIAITPGIIAGVLSVILGVVLLAVMLLVGFFTFYLLVVCGLLIVGGGVRAVLSFLGQGWD